MKLKVVLVGDRDSGKSLFANVVSSQLADVSPLVEFNRPTGTVRIVEFERQLQDRQVDVELWDVAGDVEQEAMWPVYADGMDGVILMTKEHVRHPFIDYFVEATRIQKEQSLMWVNGNAETSKPPTIGFKVTNDIAIEPEKTRSKFAKFLGQLYAAQVSRQERDEREMIN